MKKGYLYRVLESAAQSKNEALNYADARAVYPSRLYLDADVKCGPDLLRQAQQLLNINAPVYFSGSLTISKGQSFFSNAYGLIWKTMPYIRDSVTGIGCYGVNERGRELWGKFPLLHSDDKFVRMHFTGEQRRKLTATYEWPVPQGLIALIKVRARWIKGNRELQRRFPTLLSSDNRRLKLDRRSLTTMLHNPMATLAFLTVYSSASLISLLGRRHAGIEWVRAR